MTTIEDIALDAYRRGAHPLQFAETLIEMFVRTQVRDQ